MAARHVIRVQPRPYAYAFTWRYTAPFSSEQFEFKAETKKLLEIVANSLYKDKDVFVRELLSNASDALEKYRFMAVQKEGTTTEGLDIRISLDEEKRVITIQDGGIGMTKQEMIDNLGTIARSGSREFVSSSLGNSAHNIIGQFGVGFYSSFIVGHTVDVTSRHESDAKAYTWTSDGSGHFQVRESDEIGFPRGTRVSIFLKPDCAQFAKRNEIEKIIERYSNFIAFPITLNGQLLERVQAIWSKSKSDVTAEEHQRFFEYLSGSKN
jgi:HSP90 family molecular chaperone